MSLDTLKQKIKNKDWSGLVYLYGEEEYLKNFYYEQLKKKSVSVMPEFNVSEPEADKLALDTLENTINSFPMIGETRFIGIVDLSHDLLTDSYKKSLSSILNNIPDYAMVVFMDTANKGGKDVVLLRIMQKAGALCVDLERPTDSALASWGKRNFASFGKKISGEDMYYILRVAEKDMLSLKNEIKKISLFANGEIISRADIDAVVTRSLETNRFALSDALSKRDFQQVFNVVGDLYAQDYDDITIANLIYYCLVDLLRAGWALAGGRSQSEFAKDFGIHPYAAGKMMRSTRGLSEKTLLKCINLCYECELRLKGGAGDKREMVYQLIGNLITCNAG